MDLKEQQNIIDSVNHIGRIVKRYASCNIGLRAFGAKAVGMPNHVQLGNFLQFSTFFGHIWDNWGNYWGNLWHFWAICGKLCHYWSNCDTIWAILDLLGQFGVLLGQFVAILKGFNILIYTGKYAFVCKGFNDFIMQASCFHLYRLE